MTMTLTSTVGLIAIFVVDLADMYFLSLLGEKEITASIGFASTLLFFMTATCLGCQVATGANVARAEGRKDRALSQRLFSNATLFTVVSSSIICFLVWLWSEPLLHMLGAEGKTLEYAVLYADITLLSTPLLALGMCCAATLRSVGDGSRSMYTIGIAAVINGLLDPLFIFVLDLGIAGAAWATVCARVGMVLLGFTLLRKAHGIDLRVSLKDSRVDLASWGNVAVPAMLTNMASPLGSSIVLKAMAPFGPEAVGAMAIVSRITPMAFAMLFSLSGAIGPIIGQNAAAFEFERVKHALRLVIAIVIVYVTSVWLLLILGTEFIIAAFSATGLAAELIQFYTHIVVLGFLFNALLFISNAVLNNLHKAYMATVFNFSRSILGILPAVIILAPIYGAKGVMAAEAIGQVLFGILAYVYVWYWVRRLEQESKPHGANVVSK